MRLIPILKDGKKESILKCDLTRTLQIGCNIWDPKLISQQITYDCGGWKSALFIFPFLHAFEEDFWATTSRVATIWKSSTYVVQSCTKIIDFLGSKTRVTWLTRKTYSLWRRACLLSQTGRRTARTCSSSPTPYHLKCAKVYGNA